MAVSQLPNAYSLPPLGFRNQSLSYMQSTTTQLMPKWIDEEVYRTQILILYPSTTENEADESLQRNAQDLGLLTAPKSSDIDVISSSLSAITIASDTHQGSIISQSTAPTSCDSSERRPSTSLSNKSSRIESHFEMPTIMTEMERKRNSGFKSGLRKMTGFRKKRTSVSSTPSITSIKSQMTGNLTNGSVRAPAQCAESIKSANSCSSHDSPVSKEPFETTVVIDPQALERSKACQELLNVRTQQLEEKRRFLEYQTRLIRDLLDKRERQKEEKKLSYARKIAEQDEKNEKAVEEMEARQLEDELKQVKEHEFEKRAIYTRLKHMEAYCQTPSPPNSPLKLSFDHRPSIDSTTTLPERHVTQQHYENLAQAYHVRDNMDDLHASKINVLRGKQKRALQNFMLRKERELEQMEKEHEKELSCIGLDYASQEAEIRQEFEMKRMKLEARWKLQALIEKTRMERSTGLKHECLPDVVAIEASRAFEQHHNDSNDGGLEQSDL